MPEGERRTEVGGGKLPARVGQVAGGDGWWRKAIPNLPALYSELGSRLGADLVIAVGQNGCGSDQEPAVQGRQRSTVRKIVGHV